MEVTSVRVQRKTTFPAEVVEHLLLACHRHCCICHKAAGMKVEIHHIIHKNKGGADTEENGIPLCFDCHAEVGAYNPAHPKGRKFSESELRKHKEQWFRICEMAPWAREPVQVTAPPGRDLDVDHLVREIRSRELWKPAVSGALLAQVARLGHTIRMGLLQRLAAIVHEENSDDIRQNAAIVIEFLVQWDPMNVPIDLLVTMASDSFFSVRSSAAIGFCHLARMAPAAVPLDTLVRLASPREDWYVMRPAISALLFLARTRTVAVEVLASLIDTDDNINDYVADAFSKLVKIAPASLRDDIADRMLKSGHAGLRTTAANWKQTIEQRRSLKEPLDHYIF